MNCTNRQTIQDVPVVIPSLVDQRPSLIFFASLDVEVDYEYDRGVWRTANGDGIPPSLEIEKIRITSTVEQIRDQIPADWAVNPPIADAEICLALAEIEKSDLLGDLVDDDKFSLSDDSEPHWLSDPPEYED